MVRRIAPVLLLSLAACKPTNADLTSGSYTMFLSKNTSPVIFENKLQPSSFGDIPAVDCRELEEDSGEELLPNALDICGDEAWPPQHETWMTFDGYYVIQESLDVWRGEAVITSENDLQLTFHHRLPDGEDFRFAIVVDPNFQPQECVQTEDGTGVELVDRDDGSWLEGWSSPDYTLSDAVPDDGTTFLINAYAYQFSPSDLGDVWSLPQEWLAGFTTAKWSGEEMILRSTRFGMPAVYVGYEALEEDPTESDLFYTALEAEDDPHEHSGFQAQIEEVIAVADEVEAEFDLVAQAAGGGFGLRPVVHTNEWRPPDGLPAGLDGWVELHYNWIHFDQAPEDLAVGEPASGTFQLFFEGTQSQSRMMVEGSFEVDRIKKDRWVTHDIEQEKLEENNTEICGETYGTDE